MSLLYLTQQNLYSAIIKGCQSLVAARDHLNAINVFPVADGDTGDNLASTANAIIGYTEPKTLFKDMLNSVADASVLGARGNSGIIFSQFFNALANQANIQNEVNLPDFSLILMNVAKLVRESIASPVEGTILTMMEAFATHLNAIAHQVSSFIALKDKLLPRLQETLNTTTETIDILKNSHVVDAGALGFYLFVEGVVDSLSDSTTAIHYKQTNVIEKIEDHTTPLDTPPVFRYCTEAIIRGSSIDKSKLKTIIEKHGDSIAFTGNDHICRFHIHTNEPWHVFTQIREQGTIEYPKVDDMQRQFEMTHCRKHEIALVTDSSADIPQYLRDEYQVHLIPINVHLDEHTLLDRYCLDPELFYQNLKSLKNHPKTSLPSPTLIEEKLTYLSQHYQKVLVISVAKSISGTFDVFRQTAEKFNNIHVVDSRTNSGAQGLLVEYAGDLINSGLPFETIVQLVTEATAETSLLVMVDNLESMIRSGRINKIAGRIGQFSGLKPIVSIDENGKGSYLTQSFNAKNALLKIIDITQERQRTLRKKIAQYCIIHAGAKEQAHAFAALTTKAFQMTPAYIEEVSAAIGLHAGHGCVALATRMQAV